MWSNILSFKYLHHLPSYLILFSFLFIGFVPNFYTIDNIGSQWFYLSLLNFVFIIVNINHKDFFSFFLPKIYALIAFRYFLLFSFLAFLSLFYTQNLKLSIVDFSRLLIIIFSILNLSFILFKKSIKLYVISVCISITLFFEVAYSFVPLIQYLINDSFFDVDFNLLSFALKGVAGNKNIMASSIAFKLPFLIYLIFKSTKKFKYLFSIILSFSLVLLYFLSARASYISAFLSISLFLFYLLFFQFKSFLKSFLFILVPFLILFFSIQLVINIDSNYGSNTKMTNLSIVDESSNNRLILYENALDYISNHPIIGCGIGNWKIESLPYWKSLMSGYIVPYHAHNDFLELATETGLLGGLSYLFVFISIFLWSLNQFRIKKDIFSVLIFCVTSVYFIDAMLNFPLERAISQVNFITIISLLFFHIN